MAGEGAKGRREGGKREKKGMGREGRKRRMEIANPLVSAGLGRYLFS